MAFCVWAELQKTPDFRSGPQTGVALRQMALIVVLLQL